MTSKEKTTTHCLGSNGLETQESATHQTREHFRFGTFCVELAPALLSGKRYEKLAAMRKPGFGESNLGAVAGAVVGSVGGLFALGVVRAILLKDISALLGTPLLGVASWVVSLPCGWLLGGQIGPRMGEQFRSQRGEIIGGALGGLIPVLLIAGWGCYMLKSH